MPIVHTVPKYSRKDNAMKAAEGFIENLHVVEQNSCLTSGSIPHVDGDALKEYFFRLRGNAYAVTVTGYEEADAEMRELEEAKRAPPSSLIKANGRVDRAFLLEEPAGKVEGPISYIMLSRNENGNSYMLQKLEPGSVSEEHMHGGAPGITELTEYHVGLFGMSEEVTDKGPVRIRVDDVSEKPPGMAHMIRNSGREPARTLIVMAPASKGRDDKFKTNRLKWPA